MKQMTGMDVKELFGFVKKHAEDRNLTNTLYALEILRANWGRVDMDQVQRHLSANRMLIDIHVQLSTDEEDVMLCASVIHSMGEGLWKIYLEGMDERIRSVVETIGVRKEKVEVEMKAYYDRIMKNRLALLIVLADRGNFIERLYKVSNWYARQYIYETRWFIFPMCVYAKENYYDLLAPICTLMEKMRSLLDVAEILITRYEVRENELMQQILAIREENATIIGIIRGYGRNQEELNV